MRISVNRSGGYAGVSEVLAQIDTAALDSARADRIASLLAECGFFALPARIAGGATGADMFRYEISVEDGPRRHAVSFLDNDGPAIAPLKRLIAALTE